MHDWTIPLRCYLCTCCGAVLRVGPRGVLPRRRFTAFAIALSLAAWIMAGETARAVRARFSAVPFQSLSHATWRGMLRWIDAIHEGRLLPCVRGSPAGWSRRRYAERIVSTIRAMAPPSSRTSIEREVFDGAFRAARAA